MDLGNTSSDESIFHEQSRKLYLLCDVEKKGFVLQEDLRAIEDYMPEHDYKKMCEEVGKKAVNEYTFYSLLKQVIQASIDDSPTSSGRSKIESSLSDQENEIFAYQTNLADELDNANASEKIVDHHLNSILKEGFYDMRSFQVQQPKATTLEEEVPVQINNAIYRPIQPEVAVSTPSLADELNQVSTKEKEDLETPERIFKVVFVGDSAVGKTCFLHRFCHNRFKPLFNATIGVDFTVKTLRIAPNRLIAMQLWDTAGQERFRSITKQYFRKADGVVLMFDVTSEQSFLNVRNWMDSVKAGVDESTVMCLVGNKVDLFGNETSRNFVCKAGEKLAQEFDVPFYETSAHTGYGIEECMKKMAEFARKK